jgi:hypothetical protein
VDHFQLGKEKYNQNKLDSARTEFAKVSNNLQKYDSAQFYIARIDSALLIENKEKILLRQKADSINNAVRAEEAKKSLIQEIDLAIYSAKNFRINDYTNSLQNIRSCLILFDNWSKLSDKLQYNTDSDIIKLFNEFKSAASSTQSKYFPQLRKAYGNISDADLWEVNIDVVVKSSGYRTIEYIGGSFADNATIKDAQSRLVEMQEWLRFTRAQYKWYSGASEYTYYNLNSKKDNEL